MPNLDAKIEIWKNKLLDMGKRNRLLNFKDTSKSVLKILSPDYMSLYQVLTEAKAVTA